MGEKSYARIIQKTFGLQYQQSVNWIRKIGDYAGEYAKKNNISYKDALIAITETTMPRVKTEDGE